MSQHTFTLCAAVLLELTELAKPVEMPCLCCSITQSSAAPEEAWLHCWWCSCPSKGWSMSIKGVIHVHQRGDTCSWIAR